MHFHAAERLFGNAHDAAECIRARQASMGLLHGRNVFDDVRREGGNFSARNINVQDHVLAGGGEPSVIRVTHFHIEVNALFVIINQLNGDAHRHIGFHLAPILDVTFGCEGGPAAGRHIVGSKIEKMKGFVDGAIEHHMVIGHVEMAIIVDPAGLGPHGGGYERGEEESGCAFTLPHSPPFPLNHAPKAVNAAKRLASSIGPCLE